MQDDLKSQNPQSGAVPLPLRLRTPLKSQIFNFQELAIFLLDFAPQLHHENSQIAGVLPDIACTFIGNLLSVPSFFGVSRAVSICFCTWSIENW